MSTLSHEYRRSLNSDTEFHAYQGETGTSQHIVPRNRGQSFFENMTQCEGVKVLLQNKIYVLLTLSTSCLYFVITGVQFWITDYMIITLNVPKNNVFIAFGLLCITAPCIGVLAGGVVIHHIGGYHVPETLGIVCFFGFLSCIVGIPIPFMSSFLMVTGMLWLLLFLGGFMMPALSGMILHSAPKGLKALSASICYVFYNCLGYLPAPFLYGYVSNLAGDPDSRVGMKMLMFWTIIGNMFLQLALVIRSGTFKEIKKLSRRSRSTRPSANMVLNEGLITSSESNEANFSSRTDTENPNKTSSNDESPLNDKADENLNAYNYAFDKEENENNIPTLAEGLNMVSLKHVMTPKRKSTLGMFGID